MAQNTAISSVCRPELDAQLDPGFFKALCDPVRLALVARLAGSPTPLTVTDASSCCGTHFSGVSRHLAILKNAGLVEAEKRGREVYYSLKTKDLSQTLRQLADALDECANCCVDNTCA